ncbi:MAG: glycosyltransferase family 4 protein [Gammaproteobacteria bacterium]|nr:glycosyltransferase family 4 protein [Gammaproteobacteria bacterium]
MTNILHLIDTAGPGGAETVFRNIVTRLDRIKYRSIALITRNGWLHDSLMKGQVAVRILNNKGSFNIRYLFRLLKVVRGEHIDLIHAHLLGSGVYGVLAGLLCRRPVIVTLHGIADLQGERFIRVKLFVLHKYASVLVVVSDNLKQYMITTYGIKADRIQVIHNGVAAGQQAASSDVAKSDKAIFKVGLVGNIRPAKDYFTLLKVAARLRQLDDRFEFLVAGQGKGELWQQLHDYRAQLRLDDRVSFLGFCDDVSSFMDGMDIFLLTSSSEGFSIVVIEAMTQGLPVVATRCGGPEEIITDKVDGLLIEAGDVEGIAAALSRLADDPMLRSTLGVAGRQTVQKRFTMDAMMDRYHHLYDKSLPLV